MQEMKLMSLDEKFVLLGQARELQKQGKMEEAEKLQKQIPLAPYLAKFHKEHLGIQSLLDSGWNLAEAVAKYGPEFLSE